VGWLSDLLLPQAATDRAKHRYPVMQASIGHPAWLAVVNTCEAMKLSMIAFLVKE
jgi:hypothetical protein